MATHCQWLDIILNPHLLDRQFMSELTEREIFDLLVHLINNGINLLTSLTQGGSDELRKNIESKKFNIIRFLVFKLLSHFKWDLHKILHTLPSVHQEFAFSEFKRFCEQENVPDDWRNFASLVYHRWILYFVLKSIYPRKPQKIGLISVNQQLLDPYYVPLEVQDGLVKKFQNICLNSLAEIEKIVAEFDNGRVFDISMPQFDCFAIEDTKSQKIQYLFTRSDKFNKGSFLNEINYELGKWYFIHENYPKANLCFAKVNASSNFFKHLDGYKFSAQAMDNKDFKIHDPKELESFDKKINKYLEMIVKKRDNMYDFEIVKSSEIKKVLIVLKKFNDTCRSKEDIFLFTRLSKYIIFRTNGLYEALDSTSKSLFLNIDKSSDGADESEVIEEGEINTDEELSYDDDPELMLLEAIEPEQILSLISSINKAPLSINSKWILPESQMSLIVNSADYFKCHLILAKANELRNANYFDQSRVLYRSLMEDIQASNPALAEIIRFELLHTDLEICFNNKDVDERMMADVEMKCLQRLQTMDARAYANYREIIELACVFLVDHFTSIKDFINSPYELLRFCACLSCLTMDTPTRDNDKRAKEVWEFLLFSYTFKEKFSNNYSRIPFYVSMESFISKFRNPKIISIIATCLAKVYNNVKDNTSPKIALNSQFDFFPSSIPSNVLNNLTATNLVLDKTLRTYIDTCPNDLQLLKYYGDYLLSEELYFHAMKYFVRIVLIQTNYFSSFDCLDSDDLIVQQMITCSTKMDCHIQAAVLYQLLRSPDYGLAFKELNQQISSDSSDDLCDCIWDMTLLEFLVNHHFRRGDDERRLKVTRLISQLDLNINNSETILREAANLRKNKLFRMLAKQYV